MAKEVEYTPEYMNFIIRKDFDWDSIFEEMSDKLMEDEFNSPTAEAALDVACDLYPDEENGKPLCQDYLMEVRHDFVSEFMEHCRCEYIKQCASNLGMFTKEEAQNNVDLQAKEITRMWKNRLELQAKNFAKMSSYEHSKWKQDYKAVKMPHGDLTDIPFNMDSEDHHVPQDSIDESWEQMRVMQQQMNNNHSQDI